jgi:hypothetical protein
MDSSPTPREASPAGMLIQILRSLAGFSAMMRCSCDDAYPARGDERGHHRLRLPRIILFSILIALPAAAVSGGEPEGFTRVPQVGEVLRYKVKWHFIRLGTITVKTFRDSTCAAPADFRVAMIVESNPDIAFLSIREYNECAMLAGTAGSQAFKAKHYDGELCTIVRREYLEGTHTLVSCITDGRTGAVTRADTSAGVTTYVEGPSLFLFARCAIGTGGSRSIPTCVGNVMSTTDFEFDNATKEVGIDACAGPIRTRHFSGFAHWTGGSSAGVTGEFEGWLSDDSAAVPIRAEMKTILGPVSLQLEEWTRDGWSPQPVFQASSH